jgi:hypothetical protein
MTDTPPNPTDKKSGSNDMPPGGLVWHDLSGSEKTHLAGIVILFLGVLGWAVSPDDRVRYLAFIGVGILALGGGGLLVTMRAKHSLLVYALLFYLGAMVAFGYWNGNFFPYWARDITAFITFLAVWGGADDDFLDYQNTIYYRLMLMAFVAGFPSAALYARPSSQEKRQLSQGFGFKSLETLNPSLYLIFFVHNRRGWAPYVVYGCIATAFLFGVLTATRGAVLMPLISIAIDRLFVAPKRGRRSVRFTVSILLVAMASFLVWTPAGLQGAMSVLQERWQQPDLSSGRADEANSVMEGLSTAEVIFGRGLGGAHVYDYSPEIDNREYGPQTVVHFGPLHLVLKGGVVLLFLVSLLVLLGIVNGLRRSDINSRASMATLLLFSIANLSYTQFNVAPVLPLFWRAMGHTVLGKGEPQAEYGAEDRTD